MSLVLLSRFPWQIFQRISNFLLWDLAYAELYFPEVFWPDFDSKELGKAIEAYSARERRFGGV